ncbi:MAG TPA: LuxR C-terminal-related transcriptional regulator [Candidatus Dormibacteraeota bacterium]|nr:LuxR C-terminal-related transcriptional regulator [Candidatus Dormibacteraeota bacterium]
MTAFRRGRGRPPHPDVLTPAEWHVLDLVRHGMTRREIARRRDSSLNAVKYHLANIAGKLGVPGTRALRHWPGYPAASPLSTRKEGPMSAAPTALQLGPIGQVSLSIRDVGRAERFYRDTLGLPHLFTFGDLVFFDASGVRVYLHRKDADEWRPGSILYFLVEDIAVAHQALLDRGVSVAGAPHLIYTDDATGVEEWMAFFDDGEGNTLALMSRVSPSS